MSHTHTLVPTPHSHIGSVDKEQVKRTLVLALLSQPPAATHTARTFPNPSLKE